MKKQQLTEICKTIGISPRGTKSEIQQRICDAVKSTESKRSIRDVPKTVAGLLKRRESERLAKLAGDLEEMYKDDASFDAIKKTVVRLHGVNLRRVEYEVFLDVIDAADKNDYEYIEDNMEGWLSSSKSGVALARVFVQANQKRYGSEVYGAIVGDD